MSARKVGPFVRHCALICLPALALCAVGVCFLATEAPRIVAGRKGECTLRYKAVASGLLRHPERVTFRGRREKGWRQTSKVAAPDGRIVPWGHVRRGERELVWLRVGGDELVGAEVRPIDEGILWVWLYVGIPLALLVVVAMSGFGLWFIVHYARSRDDFVNATMHDLTTPLVGLRGALGSDDETARLLVRRMFRLLENLRAFQSLGGRRAHPACIPVDLVKAYEEAYALFRDDFRELFDGEDVAWTGPETLLALGDEAQVVQILWNLLGNGYKYAAPYGRVRVAFAVRNDGMAEVAFADEGPGMTRRQMRRAFDRYYRAGTVKESGRGGFGLGLCTARECARAMGGDLTVGPNQPRGCRFVLTLPAVPREEAAVRF